MKFSVERNDARLELRLLELEDTVAVMAQVVGMMGEMLGRLNEVAAHYADTVSSLLPLLPRDAPQPVPLVSGEPGAGRCAGDCACAADDGLPDGTS